MAFATDVIGRVCGKLTSPENSRGHRSKNYDYTHRILINKTVEIIEKFGIEAASISSVARAARINRSTVYYHFDSLGALIGAVRKWSWDQIASRTTFIESDHNDHVSNFVLSNPAIVKLWVDDFISVGDIHQRYPKWSSWVAEIAQAFADAGDNGDAEVYCTLMVTSFVIAPRIFRNSVRPDQSLKRVVERFMSEQQRIRRVMVSCGVFI
jgi:AcrR family transcriptional regulator